MNIKNKPNIIREFTGEKRYCGCGKTSTPPYCNEAHLLCRNIKPLELYIDVPKTVTVCGCGKSASIPYCDGSRECAKPI